MTEQQITISDDGQEIILSKAYEDRLVAGGFIYSCEECGSNYHLDPEHTWQTLATALAEIQNDLAVSAPII